MAHIIALQGIGSSGKTQTLIQVFGYLQAKYPAETVQILHRGTIDIKVVLRDINGKVVGIESQGDPNSRLQHSLAEFLTLKCDVIFCACRSSGMTVNWINALSPPHNVQFVQKLRAASNYAIANSADATALIAVAGL